MTMTVDEIMAQVERRMGRTQHRRSNNSKGLAGAKPSIELLQHHRRSDVVCGRVALLRNRVRPGEAVAARLFCKRRSCPGCDPQRRARLAQHFTEVIGTTSLVRVQVDRGAWTRYIAKVRRAAKQQGIGADYLRLPAPDGRYTVLATSGPGEPVTDNAAAVAEAIRQMPADDPTDTDRVSSSRAWATTNPAGQSDEASGNGASGTVAGWELLGFASLTLDQVVTAAKLDGLYVGPVTGGAWPRTGRRRTCCGCPTGGRWSIGGSPDGSACTGPAGAARIRGWPHEPPRPPDRPGGWPLRDALTLPPSPGRRKDGGIAPRK